MPLLLPAALVIAFAVWLGKRATASAAVDEQVYYADDPSSLVDLIPEAQAVAEEIIGSVVSGSPANYFSTSERMRARLKLREGLRLSRYRLGDGGWTIGYGRYYADGTTPPPEAIDRSTAERWFDEDLVDRGEKWVKLYVTAPISQNQFDALVSMAYNLRPSSFKKIAEAVNAGQDPTPIAMQYTRPGTNLQAGLINRRNEELGIYFGTMEA